MSVWERGAKNSDSYACLLLLEWTNTYINTSCLCLFMYMSLNSYSSTCWIGKFVHDDAITMLMLRTNENSQLKRGKNVQMNDDDSTSHVFHSHSSSSFKSLLNIRWSQWTHCDGLRIDFTQLACIWRHRKLSIEVDSAVVIGHSELSISRPITSLHSLSGSIFSFIAHWTLNILDTRASAS